MMSKYKKSLRYLFESLNGMLCPVVKEGILKFWLPMLLREAVKAQKYVLLILVAVLSIWLPDKVH